MCSYQICLWAFALFLLKLLYFVLKILYLGGTEDPGARQREARQLAERVGVDRRRDLGQRVADRLRCADRSRNWPSEGMDPPAGPKELLANRPPASRAASDGCAQRDRVRQDEQTIVRDWEMVAANV